MMSAESALWSLPVLIAVADAAAAEFVSEQRLLLVPEGLG
jgi:hypothetical protein